MFVKETHFSSRLGLGAAARDVQTGLQAHVRVPGAAFGCVCTCAPRALRLKQPALWTHPL